MPEPDDQAKPDKPDDDQVQLLNYITKALDIPAVDPADDLGVPLPPRNPAPPAQSVRGHPIEEIKPKPSPTRRLPAPPYRCYCGTRFDSAEDLLAHRHPDEAEHKLRDERILRDAGIVWG